MCTTVSFVVTFIKCNSYVNKMARHLEGNNKEAVVLGSITTQGRWTGGISQYRWEWRQHDWQCTYSVQCTHAVPSTTWLTWVHLRGSIWWYTDQWVHRCQQVSSTSVHNDRSMVTWPHPLLPSLKGYGALLGTISLALCDVLGLPNFQNPHHSEQQI